MSRPFSRLLPACGGNAPLIEDRARELGRAGTQFIEQPGILDGDHGLVGEAGEQRDPS
jgi:hypothetical protein